MSWAIRSTWIAQRCCEEIPVNKKGGSRRPFAFGEDFVPINRFLDKSYRGQVPADQRFSIIRESQIVEVDVIRILPLVPIHLIVDGHAVPARSRPVVVGPVKVTGDAIQCNGLIGQLVVGSSLHLNGEMIPRVAFRIARDSSRYPVSALVIPNVPFVAAGDAALMAEDESHIAEKLVDIELQRLRRSQVISKEI